VISTFMLGLARLRNGIEHWLCKFNKYTFEKFKRSFIWN
jgi:hypothetical protein